VIDLEDELDDEQDLENVLAQEPTSKRFAKILHQRNEARKEAATLKNKYQSFDLDDEAFDPHVYANQRNLQKKYADSEKYFDKIQEVSTKNP